MRNKIVKVCLILVICLSFVFLVTVIFLKIFSPKRHISEVANNQQSKIPTPPTTYIHVQKNHIVTQSGTILVLHGTQIPSHFNLMKWDNGKREKYLMNATVFRQIQAWHMNVIRIPVAAYMYQLPNYMATLDSIIAQAHASGLYVVLANFEDKQAGGGNSMVDQQGVQFMQFLAIHYKNDPMIMFDVINEPKYPDWISWQTSLNKAIATIRSTGAQQIIIAEANNGGGSLEGIGNSVLSDPNIVYSIHTYLSDLHKDVMRSSPGWDSAFGNMSTSFPIYVGEWAFEPNASYPSFCANITPQQATDVVSKFLAYLQIKGVSWSAYSFVNKQLIVDTTSFVPTSLDTPWCCGQGRICSAGMGEIVKAFLAQ